MKPDPPGEVDPPSERPKEREVDFRPGWETEEPVEGGRGEDVKHEVEEDVGVFSGTRKEGVVVPGCMELGARGRRVE